MVKYRADKINFVIILNKREKWNFFLQFSSICTRDNSYFYIILVIIISGILGSMIFIW